MIYLASPFWHKDKEVREFRTSMAVSATIDFIKSGLCVFSPIAYIKSLVHVAEKNGVYCDFESGHNWEFWRKIDFNYVARCSELWVLCLPGWIDSVGVRDEIKFAEQLNKPIYLVNPIELNKTVYSYLYKADA